MFRPAVVHNKTVGWGRGESHKKHNLLLNYKYLNDKNHTRKLLKNALF